MSLFITFITYWHIQLQEWVCILNAYHKSHSLQGMDHNQRRALLFSYQFDGKHCLHILKDYFEDPYCSPFIIIVMIIIILIFGTPTFIVQPLVFIETYYALLSHSLQEWSKSSGTIFMPFHEKYIIFLQSSLYHQYGTLGLKPNVLPI